VSLVGAITTQVNPNAGFLYAYQHPHTRLETLVANGDGEAYAQVARDPLMSHLSGFDSPYFRNQAEYRLSRPLWGWLIFLASFGQKAWTFGVMFALEWLSVAALAYIATRKTWWGLAILLLPGVISAVTTLTPEPFGMALALTGWFPLIGLVRETYLLFPLAAFIKTRQRKYLIPFAVYGGWQAIVYLRGARGEPKGLLGLPGQGFLHAVPNWTLQDWCGFGLLVVLGLIAFRRYPVEAALFWCLALVTRTDSWARYLDLGRVVLPLEVLGVLTLATLRSKQNAEDTLTSPSG
jgi:hypothetical protein